MRRTGSLSFRCCWRAERKSQLRRTAKTEAPGGTQRWEVRHQHQELVACLQSEGREPEGSRELAGYLEPVGFPAQEGYLDPEGCPVQEGCPELAGCLVPEGCPEPAGYLDPAGYLEPEDWLASEGIL
jgi:hypothetical protein